MQFIAPIVRDGKYYFTVSRNGSSRTVVGTLHELGAKTVRQIGLFVRVFKRCTAH